MSCGFVVMEWLSMHERDTFLRSALIPLSQQRTGRYGLLQPGSGALIATDRLGILAANLLLDGISLNQVHERLIETGALSAQGFDTLASALTIMGAVGELSSMRRHRRFRAFACRSLGKVCTLGFTVLPALPYAVTRRLLNWAPRLVRWLHTPAGAQWYLHDVLSKSGTDYMLPSAHNKLIRDICDAATRTLMIRALSALATPTQADTFIRQAVEMRGMEGLQTAVTEGGAVVACLHGEGFPALLSIHAHLFARAAFLALADMVSIRLDTNAPPPDYTVLAGGAMVSNVDAMAARKLVRHVVAGGIVTVPFDSAPIDATNGHLATLAGRTVRASLGSAWLAVQSGRPLYLATTYWDGERLVVDYGDPLSVPDGMSKRERVQALTAHLYERADRWIQAHPGKWVSWTCLESFAVGPSVEPLNELAAQPPVVGRPSANAKAGGAQVSV
jgi:lauroyl/myristoyl acyltransferase